MLFNLIVRADEALPMLTSRMFERTPDELADRYRTSTSFDFNALAQLPTVMAREFESDDMDAMARLGYMDSPSINPVISSPVSSFHRMLYWISACSMKTIGKINALIGGFARGTLFACFQSFLIAVPCRSNLKPLLRMIKI